MKQKVLGATLVLGAPVSSLASYSSKGDKLDLSKLTDISAIFNIEIKKDGSNGKTILKNMLVKDNAQTKKFSEVATAENFKNSFSFTLLTGHTDSNCDKACVKTFKVETEEEGKNLKITEITGDNKNSIEPGTYVLVTLNDNGSEVTVEKKVFEKKQKLDGKSYKNDDGK